MFLAAYGSGGGSYTGYWVALAIVVAIAVALTVSWVHGKRARRIYVGATTRSDRPSSEPASSSSKQRSRPAA
jgi:hypothetical protein